MMNLRRYGFLLLGFLGCLGVLGACFWYYASSDRTLTQIAVRGDFTMNQEADLKQAILPFLTHHFWGVNLQRLQSELQGLPWVQTALVERVFPNQLSIDIMAEKPVAQFGSNTLLNVYGELVTFPLSSATEQSLPIFTGSPMDSIKMLGMYQQFVGILSPLALRITQLTLTSDQFWSLTLNNDMQIVLGDDDVFHRLQRFVNIYPKVFATSTRRAQKVDLEYDNGMAVLWGPAKRRSS